MKKLIFGIIILLFNSILFSQVPKEISYQGRILESSGTPVVDGIHLMNFTIWKHATSSDISNLVFSETQNVDLINGFFNVNIGSASDLSNVQFNNTLWLEIKFGTNAPYPRTMLTTVPYAFFTFRAETAIKADLATTVEDGAITQTKLADGVQAIPMGAAGGSLSGEYPNPTVSDEAIIAAIGAGSITQDKLAPNVTAIPIGEARGDLSGYYPEPTIRAGAIRTEYFAPEVVTDGVLAPDAVITSRIMDNAVTLDKLAHGGRIGQIIWWDTVGNKWQYSGGPAPLPPSDTYVLKWNADSGWIEWDKDALYLPYSYSDTTVNEQTLFSITKTDLIGDVISATVAPSSTFPSEARAIVATATLGNAIYARNNSPINPTIYAINDDATGFAFVTEGDANINGELLVQGATAFIGNFDVDGLSTLSDAVIGEDLEVLGNTLLHGTLQVINPTSLNNTLTVDGLTTLNSDLDVYGMSWLEDTEVYGYLWVEDIFEVEGISYLYNNLEVSGNTLLFGTLQLPMGTAINEFSTDGTLFDNSNIAVPTEQAVKTYVDNNILALTVNNGLTENPNNTFQLGGTLIQNTTITEGAFNMIHNLNSTGDFDIQDNGVTAFFVRDDGFVGIGTNAPNQQLEITRNMRIPTTTASAGIVYKGANTYLHSYGTDNVFLGDLAGNLTNTASRNVGIGSNALSSLSSGNENTAVGFYALRVNTTGVGNVAMGHWNLSANTTGGGNTAIGGRSLINNTTASYNTALGDQSLFTNTTGANNVALGASAMISNTNGSQNTAVGMNALYSNTTGVGNTAFGLDALRLNTIGGSNVSLGYQAGYSNVSGTGNVFLGYQAGYSETGSGKLYIDNSNIATPLIYGDFTTNAITINGTLTLTGNSTLPTVTISGGTIINTSIGSTTRSSGAFTTLTANAQTTFNQGVGSTGIGTGTLLVTGGTSISENLYVGVNANVTGALTATTVNTGNGANELFAMDQNVRTTDAPTFATVNTGNGPNELFAMDQNVRTTDAPTFATVNTGNGPNELFAMNQNVRTTDNVTFANITATGTLVFPANSITDAMVVDALTINAGTINNTPIGAGTRNSGAFTTLNANQGIGSTGIGTGTLVVTGGTSISENLYVGGLLTLTGALTALTVNTGFGANELYAMDQNVRTTDAPTFATVNTGNGPNELFAMDQNVRTTDAPTFATVNTGNGANELFAMNQNVRTTDNVTFANLTATGTLVLPANSISDAMVVDALTINTGSINNTPIGATTPLDGHFTTLTTTSTALVGATINVQGNGYFNSTANSINPGTGALVVTGVGGAGIGGNLNVGGIINGNGSGITNVTASSVAFNNVSAGSNLNALTVGNGGTFGPTGTGVVTANAYVAGTIFDAAISGTAAIAYSKLALANSIVSADIAPDVITAADIATGAVTTAEILDATIVDADISSSAAIADTKIVDALTIAGGTINSTPIGATTPSTGAFTTLSANSTVTLPANSITDAMVVDALTINGGNIGNTPIGAGSTESSGAFTNLSVTGGTDINGDLNVNGSTNLNGTSVNIYGYTTIGNNLDVTSPVHFTNNLNVDGTITFPANSITDAMAVDALTIAGGTINSTPIGATTASTGAFTTLTTNGATTLTAGTGSTSTGTGTLVVTGGTGISENLFVGGSLNVAGSFDVTSLSTTGNIDVGGDLSVTGATTLESTLDVWDDLHISGGSFSMGEGVFNIDGMTGNTVINGTLGVNGATILDSTLDVTGTTNLYGSDLYIYGYTTINNYLDVYGTAYITDALDVLGSSYLYSDLNVDGYTYLNSYLDVTGSAYLYSDMSVDGYTYLNSYLDVTGSAYLYSDLSVDGYTYLNSYLDVSGPAYLYSDLSVDGYTYLNSDLDVTGTTTLGSYVTMGNELSPDNVTIYNDGTTPSLVIYGDTETGDYALEVNGISTFWGNMNIWGSLALASGATIDEFSTDGTLADNSDLAVPTEKAVKTYVDSHSGSESTTASNGLSLSGSDVKLGGTLINSTSINLSQYPLIFNLDDIGEFEIQDNSSTVLHVSNTGYVGIGSNNPQEKLFVAGNTFLGGYVGINRTPSATHYLDVGGSINATNGFYDNGIRLVNYWQLTGSDIYYNSGNVGIGTTTPSYKLHVNGNGYITGNLGIGVAPSSLPLLIQTSATSRACEIDITNSSNGNNALYVSTNGTGAALYCLGTKSAIFDGTVGIGNSSPNTSYELDVYGRTYLSGLGATLLVNNTNGTTAGEFVGTGTSDYVLSSVAGDALSLGFMVTGESYFDGSVGIGTNNPGQKLDIIAGNGRVETGYSWLTNSDARYKKDITTLENSLKIINSIRGVRFNLKNTDFSGKGKHIGFIAQEIEKFIPEMVITNPDGFKSVAYEQIGPYLVEAIKDQQLQIDQLKQQLNSSNDLKHVNLIKENQVIYGSSSLINGRSEIHLSKIISDIPDMNNHRCIIQVTPRGKCNGLYVEELSNGKFCVIELQDGKSNIKFDYQVLFIPKSKIDKNYIIKNEI